MHDLDVRQVAVGEDDLFDLMGVAKGLKLAFVRDGDAVRVAGAGELRRVGAPGDACDLSRGESDDLDGRIVAIDCVEIVKVASGGAHDEDAGTVHGESP